MIVVALTALPAAFSGATAGSPDCQIPLTGVVGYPVVQEVEYGAITVDATTQGLNAVAWYGLGAVPVSGELRDVLDQLEEAGVAATPVSGVASGGTDAAGWLREACGDLPG